MKRIICTLTIIATIASFAVGQNSLAEVAEAFSGRWTWVSYAGGVEGIATADAAVPYMFWVKPDKTGVAFSFNCTAFVDGNEVLNTRITISEDPSNPAFPYQVNQDLTAFLFNAVPMTSVNFRVVENGSIEFTHPEVADDHRFMFEHSADTGGCDASFKLQPAMRSADYEYGQDASCGVGNMGGKSRFYEVEKELLAGCNQS